MSRPSIILHATPPLHPVPASDAESLYYAALLQLAAPNGWALTRGDWGDNGGKLFTSPFSRVGSGLVTNY